MCSMFRGLYPDIFIQYDNYNKLFRESADLKFWAHTCWNLLLLWRTRTKIKARTFNDVVKRMALPNLFLNGGPKKLYSSFITSQGNVVNRWWCVGCQLWLHASTAAKYPRGRAVLFSTAECFCFCVHGMKTEKPVIYLCEILQIRDTKKCAHYSTTLFSTTYLHAPKNFTSSVTVSQARTRLSLW
jgi:hypothetical protein